MEAVQEAPIVIYLDQLRDPSQEFNPYHIPIVALTKYVFDGFRDGLAKHGISIEADAAGSPEHWERKGAEWPHQLFVRCEPSGHDLQRLSDSEIQARYLDPAIKELVDQAAAVRPSRFAFLPIPICVEGSTCVSDGKIPVRGVRAYEVIADVLAVRFDVLCQ